MTAANITHARTVLESLALQRVQIHLSLEAVIEGWIGRGLVRQTDVAGVTLWLFGLHEFRSDAQATMPRPIWRYYSSASSTPVGPVRYVPLSLIDRIEPATAIDHEHGERVDD